MKRICFLIQFTLLCVTFVLGQTQKSFTVDFSKVIGPIKPLTNVTAGPESSIVGYKDARIKMIRTNDYYGPCDFPFYTDFFKNGSINAQFDPTDPSHYFWHDTDSVLTINNDNGFETFFRLGISFNLTEKSPYWDPPYDPTDTTYNNISEVFKRTAMHYNDGWDNGFNYNIKYWNVWTEPDGGFWNINLPATTYYRMYEAVANKMKKYDSTLKVGGAGFLSGNVIHGGVWITDFISYCKNNNVPLDFLSWHLYNQHNPYSVYVYSDYIRTILDTAGYTNVESIITETNIDLGASGNNNFDTPKGAAWFASMLITAQSSPLDRLIMYRGSRFMNLLKNDSLGMANYTFTGFGFKSFSVLADEAPIQIDAQGSVFISQKNTLSKDTTNLMIMASKTLDNKSCYTLISNFQSTYSDYIINYLNMPWKSTDSIEIKQFVTNGTGSRFAESRSVIAGNDSLQLNISNMNYPSVVLIIMKPLITTDVEEDNAVIKNFNLKQNYPNPFNPNTIISYQIPAISYVTLKIYDVLGKEIATLINKEQSAGNYNVNFDLSNLPTGRQGLGSGVYLYKLTVENNSGRFVETKKMVLLK